MEPAAGPLRVAAAEPALGPRQVSAPDAPPTPHGTAKSPLIPPPRLPCVPPPHLPRVRRSRDCQPAPQQAAVRLSLSAGDLLEIVSGESCARPAPPAAHASHCLLAS